MDKAWPLAIRLGKSPKQLVERTVIRIAGLACEAGRLVESQHLIIFIDQKRTNEVFVFVGQPDDVSDSHGVSILQADAIVE